MPNSVGATFFLACEKRFVAQWSFLSSCATHLDKALYRPDQRSKRSNKKTGKTPSFPPATRPSPLGSTVHHVLLSPRRKFVCSCVSLTAIPSHRSRDHRRLQVPAARSAYLPVSSHLAPPPPALPHPRLSCRPVGSWRSCSSRTRPAFALATSFHANTWFPCIPGQAEATRRNGNSQVGRGGRQPSTSTLWLYLSIDFRCLSLHFYSLLLYTDVHK